MAALSVGVEPARRLFDEQAGQFLAACGSLSELELLDPSRCRGWSRLELVVHVRAGLDELAATAGIPAGRPVDTDAAGYWARPPDDRDDDPVRHILWARRTASAYSRPASAIRHLEDAAGRARAVVAAAPDRPVLFQGHAMTMGDFIATWVVELAVHVLDLDVPVEPVGAGLARRTLEALVDEELPAALTDAEAVLAGLGRTPWPTGTPRPPGIPVTL